MSNENKFSKGQWSHFYNEQGDYTIASDINTEEEKIIGFVNLDEIYLKSEEAEANAKLIACAPELLAFAVEMAKRYSNSEWIAGEANRLILKATT